MDNDEQLRSIIFVFLFLLALILITGALGIYYVSYKAAASEPDGEPEIIDTTGTSLYMQNDSVGFTAWETNSTAIIFGDDVGRLTWEDGKMRFEGDAEESAKIFFDYFLVMYIDDYIEAEIEERSKFTIDEPEMIMFEFTTEGEFAKEFKPQLFLRVTGTDLSRCFVNDRLRVELNGEIYWMRLEKDG